MKLKRFRKEFKDFIRTELLHEYSIKEIIADPFIYVIMFFALSGVYVFISLTLYIISFFV